MNSRFMRNSLLIFGFLWFIITFLWLSNISLLTSAPPFPVSSPQVKSNVTLLLMITSYAGDGIRRNIARETYLSFTNTDSRFGYMFIVGKGNITKELRQEQLIHEDIYFLDCNDGYLDLTDKILRGFEVAVANFNFQFLVKLDTDTYVNIPKYYDYLKYFEKQPQFYNGIQGVWSAKISHGEILDLVPSERRSWYMLGGGYALSYDLAKELAFNASMETRRPHNRPRKYLQINRVVDEQSVYKTDNKEISCGRNFLVNHKASELQMYYLHFSSLITGEMCAYQQNESLRKKIMVKAIEAYDLLVGTPEE